MAQVKLPIPMAESMKENLFEMKNIKENKLFRMEVPMRDFIGMIKNMEVVHVLLLLEAFSKVNC